jgi:hypothetical protein
MLTVTTQSQLDKALADGVVDLIVDAPNGAWLKICHDGLVRVWGSSRVVARESSSVEAWGSSRVVARESSSVVARESSSVEAWGSSRVAAWGSSHVESWESSSVVARESSRVVAWGSSHVEAWGSSSVDAGRWTAVHLWSQRVALTGDGHIIDMTAVDLADVALWREFTAARVDPGADELTVGHVSSQDHEGRMGRDGMIRIGCWKGTADELRTLADGTRWPSGADTATRDRFRPRLLAFADLCDEQMAAWS